jgi:Iap family predicted aminopeptidase
MEKIFSICHGWDLRNRYVSCFILFIWGIILLISLSEDASETAWAIVRTIAISFLVFVTAGNSRYWTLELCSRYENSKLKRKNERKGNSETIVGAVMYTSA